mmetsp:Transcript_42736/g.134678  ORF Transcript_42736/g.134678 Transcript_42736/m.134678 type:complete len:162 (+) Transcript_42736:880-1365(+)
MVSWYCTLYHALRISPFSTRIDRSYSLEFYKSFLVHTVLTSCSITAVLFQLIRKGEFDFPTPYWDAVSSDAMDLVSKMLVVDAKSRLNAEQCLDHPWISVSGPEAGRTLHSSHHAFMLIRKLQIFDNVDPACMQVRYCLQWKLWIDEKKGCLFVPQSQEVS